MNTREKMTKGEKMISRAETKFWAYEVEDIDFNKDLLLLDNVQFIYELSLAELELKAFGVDFEVTNGLREFKILNKSEEIKNIIKRKGSYFKSIDGELTDYFYIIQKNQTRSVNQYLTHWIYPYKGKFHPQMIRALLNIIGLKEGDTVFEPFSGSGTTALEAQLLGINFIGIDVSPLCVIQGKVKTESIFVLNKILEIKEEVISKLVPNLFHSDVNYYKLIDELTDDERVKNFYKLARLLAISDNSRRKKDFVTSYIKNINLMIASIKDYIEIKERLNLKLGKVKIEVGDSRNVKLLDNSVDGIVTSPPYSIALDYVKNDEHSLKDLGFDVSKMRNDFIGVRGAGKNRVELYNEDMKKSYSEMYRILKPGKYAVIVIGNATYQGKEVKTVEFTIDYMENIGFKLVKNINKIIFGLYNVMKKENILIFQKKKGVNMIKASGIFSWDIKEIANALKISEEDVKKYFTDGRRVSFILERRIAREFLNGDLAPNEGEDYDVLDYRGRKWEVRSISKDGIYFCPSYMVGSGRKFDRDGFLKKLDEIDGYIIADIEQFPNIPFWIISSSEVKMWWENGEIGEITKISRNKALNLISKIERYKNER